MSDSRVHPHGLSASVHHGSEGADQTLVVLSPSHRNTHKASVKPFKGSTVPNNNSVIENESFPGIVGLLFVGKPNQQEIGAARKHSQTDLSQWATQPFPLCRIALNRIRDVTEVLDRSARGQGCKCGYAPWIEQARDRRYKAMRCDEVCDAQSSHRKKLGDGPEDDQ